MTAETAIDAKNPQPAGGEATQTGGSATSREVVDVQKPPSTYSTNASDEEADVDGARDASTDGNQPDEVEGVRAG